MTALAADRNTRAKFTERSISLEVVASEIIYAGAMVAVDSNGYACAAAKTAGLKVMGRACEQADNSSGSNGDISVRVQTGVFSWVNDSNAIAQADIGRLCFVVDDQTVADETEGSPVVAGVVDSIDPITAQVWVRTMDLADGIDRLNEGLVEVVTSGALSLYTRESHLSVTGTQAYTLADGLYTGQKKLVKVTVAQTTPDGTLTPANFSDGTTIDFDAVDEEVDLEWDGSGWRVIKTHGYAPETVTSGALGLYERISLISCTGTQAYTLADGFYVGQRKDLRCIVAAATPDGTLTPSNFQDGTSMDFDAVEEAYQLEWDGTGWRCLLVVGGAIT